MYSFKEQVLSELDRLNKLYARLRSYDRSLTEGSIIGICRKNGSVSTYLERSFVEDGKRVRTREYLGKEDSPKVVKIAEARYIRKLTEIVEANKKTLEKLHEKIRPYDRESILCDMPWIYKDVILANRNVYFLDDRTASKDVASCLNESSETNRANILLTDAGSSNSIFAGSSRDSNDEKNTMEFSQKHFAITGEPVRSKSEAIIYNLLHSYGVDFRYDSIIRLKNESGITVNISPDFIINTKDGGMLIYEHMGVLNKEEYRVRFAEKLWLYGINGYDLWKNLFVSVDSINNSIDTEFIDKMIRMFILPLTK